MFMSPMQYLDSEGVQYQVLYHPHAESIQETSLLAQLPEAAIAKVVIVSMVSKSEVPTIKEALILIPGHCNIDVAGLRKELRAEDVQLVSDSRRQQIFAGYAPGCEVPFGQLYGMGVYMAKELFNRFELTFKAGNHETLIRMNMVDFCNLTQIQMIEHGYSEIDSSGFYSEQSVKPWRWV